MYLVNGDVVLGFTFSQTVFQMFGFLVIKLYNNLFDGINYFMWFYFGILLDYKSIAYEYGIQI